MSKKTPAPKEPSEHLIREIEALAPALRLFGLFNPELQGRFGDVERHLMTLKEMHANQQRFATKYTPIGWTLYDRLSMDLLGEIVELETADGETRLIAHHLDPATLQPLRWRFGVPAYAAWADILERAVERAEAQDFISAVPLVLLIIDGICTTTTQKHPFSGGADAPVFDSITAKPGGVADGLKILGATRRKLSTEPITAPYRHGIVHGLNPNYGHPVVAAKAFNLLQAMVDYFDRRRDEEARIAKAIEEQAPVNWRELGGNVLRQERRRQAIEAWTPRPPRAGERLAQSGEPVGFAPNTPEAAAAAYLDALVARNFGVLAELTVDYPNRPIGHRAGRLRADLKEVTIAAWRIVGLRDEGAAMSVVDTELEGDVRGSPWTISQPMRMLFNDRDNLPLVRGDPEGRWLVQPNYVTELWRTTLGGPAEG
jgi:hypothetical protein